MRNKEVPVIMYHSVGPRIPKHRIFYGLRMSTKTFESHLKTLKEKNFTSISLNELFNKCKLPQKSIVITFDDGYLDNWTYAYPLLKKYGFKATTFITTDFVDPKNKIRPNLLDVWDGSIKEKDIVHKGFLSWKEMKEMEDKGVIDIQSHAKTHTWYSCGDRIIDFLHPNSLYRKGYEWLVWNLRPQLKPFYLNINLEQFIKYGMPIYQYGKSLECKRYFPNKQIQEFLVEFVKKMGGRNFFKIKGWERELIEKVEKIKRKECCKGYFESDGEYYSRVYKELKESKETIEKKLNKKVNYLCWPGGSINKTNLKIAKDVGYIATTTSQGFSDENNGLIKRICAPTITVKDKNKIYNTIFLDGRFLNLTIKAYRGSIIFKWSSKVLFYILGKLYKFKASKREYYYVR